VKEQLQFFFERKTFFCWKVIWKSLWVPEAYYWTNSDISIHGGLSKQNELLWFWNLNKPIRILFWLFFFQIVCNRLTEWFSITVLQNYGLTNTLSWYFGYIFWMIIIWYMIIWKLLQFECIFLVWPIWLALFFFFFNVLFQLTSIQYTPGFEPTTFWTLQLPLDHGFLH
jgi:hypothetical protein